MTPEEVLSWYTNKVSSNFSKPRSSALKHIETIKDRFDDLRNSATRFDYSDIEEPDVYQNYATTIYKNTVDMLDSLDFPKDEITYKILEEFIEDKNNMINS